MPGCESILPAAPTVPPMKFLVAQLSHYLSTRDARRNVRALLKYLLFLIVVITAYAVLFHLIMLKEGKQHSWATGFYWVLTVMSTLGFGDITFESDLGRLFTIVVLLSGIVLLLIVLPFAFIHYFYAPLLESRIQLSAPRTVPADTEGHLIISHYDSVVPGLIRRLKQEEIPYFVIEEDPAVAANRVLEEISVISTPVDNEMSYESLNLDRARMVLVNREDTLNTKIILTIHKVNPHVPIVAIANENDSVDVLQLSGATHVLPLKKWLGEQLANRVSFLHAKSNLIGRYNDLLIAELPVQHTPLANKTVRETNLRKRAGVNIIGVWEQGHLLPVQAETRLSEASVLVLIGRESQLNALDELTISYTLNSNPVLLIGAGKVGASVAEALHEKGIPVNLVDKHARLCNRLKPFCHQVFPGDAADYHLLMDAGIKEAPSVVLTTSDDAMNVYLASYCRRLNPDLRIVSRITQERNIDVMQRAGADFVLSYSSLGAEAIFSILMGKELIVIGEGINLISMPVPTALSGKTLAESEIGASTGLTVIALQKDDDLITRISASTTLEEGAELLMLGGTQQQQDFIDRFGDNARS